MANPKPILLGADHAGFALKERLKKVLIAQDHPVYDLTPDFKEGDDYPPIAHAMAKTVTESGVEGVLVCGTGLGMDIAANRHSGVRATVVRDVRDAKLAREHNHANILILGGRLTKPAEAVKILNAWLTTKPSRDARHLRRIKQLDRP